MLTPAGTDPGWHWTFSTVCRSLTASATVTTWAQNYDPLGNTFWSTFLAALPAVVLLGSIAFCKIRIHLSALLGLGVAAAVALLAYRTPARIVAASTAFGAAYGLFPIGWIILNLMFLYQLTVQAGQFTVLRTSLAALAPDPRIQVILIAFCFGAFFEGAAGFGTPVAVTAAILISLGFQPLVASGLSLIANTAPVAYGSLGIPIIALSAVTGLDVRDLSAMVGRQVPWFSMLVPFWVVCAFAGWRGMLEVWPAALVAGLAFAIPQALVSNLHGPWLVDVVASVCSLAALAGLLTVWRPKNHSRVTEPASATAIAPTAQQSPRAMARAWLPWAILSGLLFAWGLPGIKDLLNGEYSLTTATGEVRSQAGPTRLDFAVPGLHGAVQRMPPVARTGAAPEKAIYTLNWLSASGTGILVAALAAGGLMGFSLRAMARIYWTTLVQIRYSLLTIAAMLALGYVTKYSGSDATLGLALAKTGRLYPFFGTLLGWLGVALTGSDTASNVLFGSLQQITAQQTGVSPVLMTAANSSGGVMGKMVAAQSIVVASTATDWYGHEGTILRFVFWHSLALASLMGVLVLLQAKVAPFTGLVVP